MVTVRLQGGEVKSNGKYHMSLQVTAVLQVTLRLKIYCGHICEALDDLHMIFFCKHSGSFVLSPVLSSNCMRLFGGPHKCTIHATVATVGTVICSCKISARTSDKLQTVVAKLSASRELSHHHLQHDLFQETFQHYLQFVTR